MNREFLKELGLEDDAVEKIMKEHGKTVQELKPEQEKLEGLQSEKSTLEQQLEDLQGQIQSKDDELGNLDELKKEVESERLNNLKMNIANQANIPFEFADRLNGENEEELKADAEKMAGFVNKKQPLPLKQTEPSVDDKDAGLKKMIGNLTKQGE